MPPDLFTPDELRLYMRLTTLDADLAAMALEIATTEIRNYVGPLRYDDLTDVTAFKPIALRIGKSVVFNPENLRSEKIDDYEFTISAEGLLPPELTEREEARIDKILDRILDRSSAFSITSAYPATCRPRSTP